MKKKYGLGVLLFVFFFFAYHPVIYDLRDTVIGNELARHAPLVVALACYLIYRKREQLVRVLEIPRPAGESGGPLLLFSVGLILNLLGQAAGVTYLSQLSIPLALYGMASYLHGRSFSRELIFPLLFLLLAFPIPGKIYMDLIFPLKLMVTKASGAILLLIGYPVKIFGNIIEIASVSIGVVDACSGLNSLMAILTLSIFYTYLVLGKWTNRAIIVLLMLPMILIANIIRVTATAMVSVKWGPEMAEGTLHSMWGAAVFIIAVMGLIAVTRPFTDLERRRGPHV